ncbi:dienelactone hydrolase [alpha proteobacterium U9-1i]|nr:dienelactone hydrolase [alpha proteobacterium U9-1i]
MCDDRTAADDEAAHSPLGQTSRRGFAALSLAALAACAASPADAVGVSESEVTIATPDGNADGYFVHPASGQHPGVLMWPDIRGIRPAFRMMGKRLAESGYSVLVVNPYYRAQAGEVNRPGENWSDPAVRERIGPMARALNAQTQATDGTAFLRWLDQQAAVDTRRKIGSMGYCMTGAFVMRTAAAVPERVGAGASFHGGGLTTAAPDSPHLLIPQLRGSFLIAIAENDDAQEPASKDTLRAAFDAARVPAEIEVYPARHGWCVLDGQAFDQVQADRAWARMLTLFSTALA